MMKRKVITFIGRIHPIKGIDLLEAWKEIHNEMNFSLNIFGVWEDESYIEKLKNYILRNIISMVLKLMAQYTARKRIIFIKKVLSVFSHLILKTLETALRIFDEWNASNSIKKYTLAEKVTKKQCGYVCDLDVKSFKNTLIEINSLSRSEIINLGNNGRKFALEEFSYDVVRNSFTVFIIG